MYSFQSASDAKHIKNPYVLTFKGTPCDAYAKQPESHYAYSADPLGYRLVSVRLLTIKSSRLAREDSAVIVKLMACPNGKCFTVKHAKTLLVGKTFFRLATLFCAV